MTENLSDIKTGGQQRTSRRLRPRITSLFQFLLVSEPEIKRLVDDMDKAGFFYNPSFPRLADNMGCSALRVILYPIGNG